MIELHDHQKEALPKMKNGCILWGGVGSGKSITAVAYYLKEHASSKKDIYVITTAKKRDSLDWEGEFARAAIGTTPDATIAGVLTVDSWNNIGKYRRVEGAFFIFDEQRLVGAGSWTSAFIGMARKNSWILLSATPGDTWMDYIPVFIANGFYRNRTEFKREHVVYNTFTKFPKVDRYISVGRLVRHRNSILVHMPYKRHTTRHEHKLEVEYDLEMYERVVKDRWHVYENRPLRDVAELFGVMRRVVNSASSRLKAVQHLMLECPRLIVFYNFDYELLLLRQLISSPTSKPQRSSSDGSVEGVELAGNPGARKISTVTSLPSECPVLDAGSAQELVLSRSLASESTSTMSSLTPTSSSTINPNSYLPTSDRCSTNLGVGEWNEALSKKGTGARTKTVESGNGGLIDTTTTADGLKSTSTSAEPLEVAEWNGHRHQDIPAGNSWVYLVQYTAGAEGWNCIETDTVLFFSLPYSYKVWEQARGRIDRLNTSYLNLHYYTLLSKSSIDSVIMKTLMSKKSFNESAYMRTKGVK